jgi:hypothetical protein
MGFVCRLAQKLFDTGSVLGTLYMCVFIALYYWDGQFRNQVVLDYKLCGVVLAGLIWLKIATGGGRL